MAEKINHSEGQVLVKVVCATGETLMWEGAVLSRMQDAGQQCDLRSG